MAVVLLSLATCALTALILWPPRRNAFLMGLTFFVVLPFAELVPLLLIAEAVVVWRYGDSFWSQAMWLQALAAFALLVSWTLLLRSYLHPVAKDAPFPYRHFQPFPLLAKDVVQRRGIVFDAERKLRIDVLSRRDVNNATAVLYVHGGGWVVGHRSLQGRPLLLHLAQKGYVCFAADYRLSPRATFPDHIIDVKRALAWVREHAAEYNINPDRIVITGNSAGGHLAALAALTPGLAAWQPGFEQARTDVLACMCFYGIYNLEDSKTRWRSSGLEWLWRYVVIKQARAHAPALWHSASPLHHLSSSAPPFLLVHGTHDSLVPIREAREFVSSLQSQTRAELVELRGGQHAFELGISPRARVAVAAAERFLATL